MMGADEMRVKKFKVLKTWRPRVQVSYRPGMCGWQIRQVVSADILVPLHVNSNRMLIIL